MSVFHHLDLRARNRLEYYSKRFGDNTSAAFIHLLEIGEIAFTTLSSVFINKLSILSFGNISDNNLVHLK